MDNNQNPNTNNQGFSGPPVAPIQPPTPFQPPQQQSTFVPPPQPAATAPTPVAPTVPQNPVTPLPQPTQAPAEENKSGAAALVLQWLTYGLWDWTLISLSILLSSTLTYYFIRNARGDNYSWLAYVVASTLVLLPISYLMDKFYSKNEPQHKHGFAAVIMVLNAVFVFLAFIGSLISCVVSGLTIFLSAGASDTTYIVVVSSLVVSVLSLLLFLRIMHFEKIQRFTSMFPIIIVIIAGTTAVAALAGPFRGEVAVKNDRLIEDNLPSLNTTIQSYARKNYKLPESLSDLDLDGSYQKDAQLLISKDLVSYRKLSTTTELPRSTSTNTNTRTTITPLPTTQTALYELCATYKKERKLGGSYYESSSESYLSTTNHKAGKQCYTQSVIISSSRSSSIYD